MKLADVILMQRYAATVALMIAHPGAAAMVTAVQQQIEREVRGVGIRRLALDFRRVRDRLAEGT